MILLQSLRYRRLSLRSAALLGCAAVFGLSVLQASAASSDRLIATKRSVTEPPAAELQVDIQADRLNVTADRASLAQVLARVTLLGGLEVKGPVPESVVSGQYGPGSPEAVLVDLLETLHCSYVMSGHMRNGLPREVVLLPEEGPAAASAISNAPDKQPLPETPADDSQDTAAPGAIEHVPPNEVQAIDNPEEAAQRSQQHLERLQQMEQQQGSQQQPQF